MPRTNLVFPSAIRTFVVRVAVLFCLAIVAGFSIIGAGAVLSYLLVRSVLEAWGWPAAAGALAAELALMAAAAILAARRVSGADRHSSKKKDERASGAFSSSSQEDSKAVVSGDTCDDGQADARQPSPVLQLMLAMLGDRRRLDWAASLAAAVVAAVAIVGPVRCLRIFGRCMRVAWTLRQIAQAAMTARAADPAHSPR